MCYRETAKKRQVYELEYIPCAVFNRKKEIRRRS